jgi:hypothetical protein
MKQSCLTVAIVVMAMTTSACSKLLKDDFEAYAEGQSPGGPIPGSPSCDEIATAGSPAQFTVRTTNAIAGNKSLSFEPAFADGISQIDFLPCQPSDAKKPVRFRWRGRLQGPDDSPGVQIRITTTEDPLFRAYLSFDITRSRVEIGSAGTVMHTVAGDFSRPHTVIARIVPGSPDQYFVAITGEGVNPDDAAPEGALSDLVDFRPQDAILRMLWQPRTSVSEVYLVDDVIIEEGQ